MNSQFHESAWRHVPSLEHAVHGRGAGDLGGMARVRTRVRAAWTPDAGYVAAPEPSVPGFVPLLRGAVLCVQPAEAARGLAWVASMEPAISAAVGSAGMAAEGVRRAWPRTDVLPPRRDDQLVASLHEAPDGSSVVLLAGDAPSVLGRCGREARPAHTAAARMARAGLEVLAVAGKQRPYMIAFVDEADVQAGFRLRGLLGVARGMRARAVAAGALQVRAAG